MSGATIDLNCDLGEDPARRADDARLLDIVTSANIACGGHAGDESSMRETVRLAADRGVAVGAHPGYPDSARFGRVELAMTDAEIEDFVGAQVGRLAAIAAEFGVRVVHVKPHGALYHAAMNSEGVARSVATGSAPVAPGAHLVGLAGARAIVRWRAMGLPTLREAFADRRYEPDGSLRSRSLDRALITEPDEAAAQAVAIATGAGVTAADGTRLEIDAQTICVHSDTPDAIAIARAVRAALEGAGVRVASPAAGRP